MSKAIVIGMIGFALVANRAAAQTAVERAHILRDFQQSVVDYTLQHEHLVMFPEVTAAASPAPKLFTLPVAMVFRQVIAETVMTRPAVDDTAIAESLPPLPASLHYRFNGNDLELRNREDGVVDVLRSAFSTAMTKR